MRRRAQIFTTIYIKSGYEVSAKRMGAILNLDWDKEYLAMLKESSYAGVVVDAFSYDFVLKRELIEKILA